jgi:3-oxoacyl-[acyl-carrier-protein] synthase I
MTTAVHIVATGARTPIGLHSASSAAAYRAAISGMGDHPFMIDQVGDPMLSALDALLDPSLMGPGRLLALADRPLREACTLLSDTRLRVRLPLYLALPEIRPGFTEPDAQAVRSGIAALPGLPIELSQVNALAEGHAAGLSALARAAAQINQGASEACLVGGVDSYFHPDTMEWLDENRQLAGAVSRSGFVPGEAAGFCLLMSDGALKRFGLRSLARVVSVGLSRETKLIKTPTICLGEGLTAAVRDAVRELQPQAESISDVVCDINGERYRGEEWGFVCLRLPTYFDNPTAYLSPADSWGDVGAASLPLFAMLACQASGGGYSNGSRAMLWASSEGGLRGACVIETATQTEGRRFHA